MKFDQILNELTNNLNQAQPQTTQTGTNPANTNNSNTTAQPSQPNKPVQPVTTPNQQQKPNLDQLMKDFNDPNKKITKLEDLKNYGIVIDQK